MAGQYDRLKKLLETIKPCVDFLQAASVIVGLIFTARSLNYLGNQTKILGDQTKIQSDALVATQQAESAHFALEIAHDLDDSRYEAITIAIQGGRDEKPHNSKVKILKKSGGAFTPHQVDQYLGNYDSIAVLYSYDLMDKNMAYDMFSYGAEKTYCNKDIWNYVVSERNASKGLDE